MTKEFRKNLHVAYKEKLCGILIQYSVDLLENINEFAEDPGGMVISWVNSHCLPMGDFSKEEAINEIEEWQK